MSEGNHVPTGTERKIIIAPQYSFRVEIPNKHSDLAVHIRKLHEGLTVIEKVARGVSMIYLVQSNNMMDLEKAYSTIEQYANKIKMPVVYKQ